MRKLCAMLLLALYTAFVPVCFAGTIGVAHVHEGGASGVNGSAHHASTPLVTHAQMYSLVTSADFTVSGHHILVTMLTVLLMASLAVVVLGLIFTNSARSTDRYRKIQSTLTYRKTFLYYLLRFIASPNSVYALA